MATHSSTLAWKIPWMEGPGGLQSMGLLGVGHDWETSLYFFTFMHWRRRWQPTLVFLPGESQGRGGLVGCRLWGRLKRLSSSSKDYIATCLFVGSFTFLSNIIISSFRNCGRITPHSFDLTLFLIQIMDACYSSWFKQKARFFPFCPETTFGKLAFKMNNEHISWPVNLLVARRPVNS